MNTGIAYLQARLSSLAALHIVAAAVHIVAAAVSGGRTLAAPILCRRDGGSYNALW